MDTQLVEKESNTGEVDTRKATAFPVATPAYPNEDRRINRPPCCRGPLPRRVSVYARLIPILVLGLSRISLSNCYVAKGTNAMVRVLTFVVLLGMSALAQAVEYRCKVEKKFDFENAYSQAEIEKGQFSVLIEEKGESAFLSRCSFTPSAEKVTCDRYEVDKIMFDENVRIKKYYVLRSHFDVQVFSDLSFVENNGRGGIAFGKCGVAAP